MINKEAAEHAFKDAFIKKAQEYGLTEQEAYKTLKKHSGVLDMFNPNHHLDNYKASLEEQIRAKSQEMSNNFKNDWNDNAGSISGALTGAGAALGGAGMTGPGALMGAGVGGLTGLISPSKNSKGEKERLKSMLTNAGIGGGIGAGLGWGAGAFGGATKGNELFENLHEGINNVKF